MYRPSCGGWWWLYALLLGGWDIEPFSCDAILLTRSRIASFCSCVRVLKISAANSVCASMLCTSLSWWISCHAEPAGGGGLGELLREVRQRLFQRGGVDSGGGYGLVGDYTHRPVRSQNRP